MDDVDERILALLRRNARMSLRDIAAEINLSPAPVKRRIERMEADGVIAGYTVVLDHSRSAQHFEAFAEVRLPPGGDVDVLWEELQTVPEVEQIFTIAGDPDALVRLRVDSVEHLQRVVNGLRKSGRAAGTKTLIVMKAWQRR
jgi:Lrp/AsnC family leucine-responsive transcriptional regulator